MDEKKKVKKQRVEENPLDVLRFEFLDEYVDEFYNLLFNAVKIDGLKYTDELYVKQCLFGARGTHLTPINGGRVGYDKSIDKFAAISGVDFTDVGFPQRGIFTTANGRTWERELSYEPSENGAYILYAFPSKNGLYTRIYNTAALLADISISIVQNVIATRTPDIVIVDDPETRLSILRAIEDRKRGEPVIAVTNALQAAFKGVKSDTPIIFDRLIQLRKEVRNDFLMQIGVLSANTDKRERTQSAEVYASVGEVVDSIYIPIDTINAQCEQYGLSFKMRLNSVVEEYYGKDDGESPVTNIINEE